MKKSKISSQFKEFFRKKLYLSEKYWLEQKSKGPPLIKLPAVIMLTLINFINDKCFDKAATLTFYSILSIIPLLAIGFGIAQQFGLDEKFAQQVKTQLENQPEVAEKIIQFSHSALEQTKGGLIAAFGILILLWTVFRMIVNIETYFDEIWKVKQERSFWQQVKRYIPLILLFPVFLVIAHSLILYFSAIDYWKNFNLLGSFLLHLLRFLPLILMAMILVFAYIYLPNKKIPWKSGICAGIIAAFLYQIWQWIYINFQVKSSNYGAIYGSFAAIPLFLIWLYYSWLIVLFGTELSSQISRK